MQRSVDGLSARTGMFPLHTRCAVYVARVRNNLVFPRPRLEIAVLRPSLVLKHAVLPLGSPVFAKK
jgi:hypothetical protein